MMQFALMNSAFFFVLIAISFLKTDDVLCYSMGNNQSYYYYKIANDMTKVFKTRQHRLISFNTDGDLRLDLDFTVPFITLPIQKSMDSAKTSLVNLNVGSLILSGAVIFGVAVAVPVILALFNKKGLIPSQNPLNVFYSRMGNQRSSEADYSFLWKYLNELDSTLLENDIDLTTCSQRFICLTVKKSAENVAKGKGSSTDKVFDGIISSKWFQENVLNSVLNEAVQFGLKGGNCSSLYRGCKISQEIMRNNHFVNFILDKFNKG